MTSKVRHYDAQYGQFTSELYSAVRREAFGEDIGQNSWLTADEHDLFIDWMKLGTNSTVLDVACGSGGPAIRIAKKTGCRVFGIEIHEKAVAEARAAAEAEGLASRALFDQVDATAKLPFSDATFDAIICIDAINHLPDRPAILREWARILKQGGVLVFTDPIVVSGPLTAEEIKIRSSIGFFLFVPRGSDEQMLSDAGFEVTDVADRTENMAVTARRRLEARDRRAEDLRRIEGDEAFDNQRRFLEVASRLAAERRLSRLAFRSVRQ